MGIFAGIPKQSKLPPRRATKRISLQMRFLAYGRDEGGSEFRTLTETSIVTGQGGCLILDKDVSEGQNLKLCADNGTTFFVNVRWLGYDVLTNRRHVGFKVLGEISDWSLNVVSHLKHVDFNTVEKTPARAVKRR